MRKIGSLLLATTILLPAPAAAQIRAGMVAEAGLGVSAAPVPVPSFSPGAFTLAPAAPSALALTPSLAAPAIAIAVPAAAVQALAAPSAPSAAKLVPAALTAIKPAAAKPEKPGSDQAREAATALFDGSGPLAAPATGDGPSAPGSPSDPSRASGLSPPSDAELASAYREARPQSRAVEMFGRDFAAAAAEATQQYTFMGAYFLQQMDPRQPAYRAAAEFIETHDARAHAPSRKFMQLLGRWHAFQDHTKELAIAARTAMMKAVGMPAPAPHLPPSPIPGGEYWDMAAGMNALGFIHHELDPAVKYSFFDYSPFVVSYLKTAVDLAGAKNAEIVEADLNKLTKPEKPLAVLRTKNAVHYVPGFAKKLETMADWIAPGGQLVIQTDPQPGQRAMVVDNHGPLIRRLLSEGWGLEYGFSRRPGKFSEYALDTLILTRPKLAWTMPPEETAREWNGYRAAVAKANSEFNPFGFLF